LAAPRLERWPRLAGGWAALAVLFFSTTNVVGHYFQPGPKTVLSRALGERLRADACYPGGSLFVWGYAPGVYHYAGLRPASRFVLPQATVSGFICGNTGVEEGLVDTRDRILDEHQRLLLDDLAARPPTYVIDVSGAPAYPWHHFPLSIFPELEARVAAGYELAAVVDGARILRRRGCAP
jgi:hypothetical protein